MKTEDRARVAGLLRAMAARFDDPDDALDDVEWYAINDTDEHAEVERSFGDAETMAYPEVRYDGEWGADVENGGVWMMVPVRVVRMTAHAPSIDDAFDHMASYSMQWADEPPPTIDRTWACPLCGSHRADVIDDPKTLEAWRSAYANADDWDDSVICPPCAVLDGAP